MALFTLMITLITGYGVNWTVEPARGQNDGVIRVMLDLQEEDLLFVQSDGDQFAYWEIAAGIDGDYSVRESGTVSRDDMPVMREFEIRDVSPGDHELSVRVTDLETGNSDQWKEDVQVTLIDTDSWSSSELQLMGGAYQRASGNAELIWNVYPPAPETIQGDTLTAAYVLRDAGGQFRREGWMNIDPREDYYRIGATMNLDSLPAGDYDLLAAIVSGSDIVMSSEMDLTLLQAWDVWGGDPSMTRSLIRPIARSDEIHSLEDAEGPSSRRAVMAEFWRDRDPTPGTDRNEFLEVYLDRLDHINREFSVLNTMGINTDRGRVYALLGEPDIIESRPLEISTRPTLVWTYCSPPLEVLFIDFGGVGDYELDTDWEEVRSSYENH